MFNKFKIKWAGLRLALLATMSKEEKIKSGIVKAIESKGYKFFTDPFSMNLFAVRCETGTDEFDDIIGTAVYNETNDLIVNLYKGTTEPGMHWLKNPMRKTGCAIMVEGQYRGAFKLGPHGRTKYEACRQFKDIPVYRDNNKDNKHDLDPSTIETGINYTNIHHGWSAPKVDKNSAGCIVIQSKSRFNNSFLPTVRNNCKLYGSSFTFTLLSIKDFK